MNFVVGGTQKGGTSALDAFLRQHPEICMPSDLKEVHFFDREDIFQDGQPNYGRYHSHFKPDRRHQAIGEASPIYMYWNSAPYRIWTYNPAMKWILILRNPVERAYSAWNMERQRGAEHLSFNEAIAREPVRCREALPLQHRVFSYVDRGFYAGQIRRLYNIFGRENCLVAVNEDLRAEHERTMTNIYRFLGVSDTVAMETTRVFEHEYEQPLEPETRNRLTDLFYFDVKELERLIDRDLSMWYADRDVRD